MKKILIAVSALLSLASWAQKVTLSVDRTTFGENEAVSLEVEVEGSFQGDDPLLQNVEAFEVESAGKSSQTQIINGDISSSILFQYSLMPKKKGVFTIGPAQIKVKGKVLKSNTVRLKVVKGEKVEGRKNYFVRALVSNKKPYVNEQVTYKFQFFSRVRTVDAGVKWPSFEEFWKEGRATQKDYSKTIGGVRWSVTEINFSLFPQQAGEIIIPPHRHAP